MEENNAKKEEPKKTLLDMNASWPLMFVYIGYLIGMFYVQKTTYTHLSSNINTYAYVFVSLIVGLLSSLLIYNLGKLVFASLAGYRVSYVYLLGFCFDHSGKKKRVTFDIADFFDLRLQFVPKDDDIKKKPTLIFVGGYVFSLIFIAIFLTLFFVLAFKHDGTSNATIGWGAFMAGIYGLIIPLYEIMPFRQDSANDMYNLLVTRSEDDKTAFNIVKVNEKREFSGEDFLIPSFNDYCSYYKAQTLYYSYLNCLYSNELEKAVSVLDEMKRLNIYLPEEDDYLSASESIYLRYLIDDTAGADKLYLTMKGDDKKAVTSPKDLANYRTALLVLGNITSDKEGINSLINDYNKKIASLTKSNRVVKEDAFFKQAYEKLRTNKPNLNLKDLK